jgi:uncharacterized protein (TIGR04255 family)
MESDMSERPCYERKPLREAVFELFSVMDELPAWSDQSFRRVFSQLPLFAHHEEALQDFGLEVDIAADGTVANQRTVEPRMRRWDQAKQKAVQIGPHMCAYNVLADAYTVFEDQLDTIKQVIQAYLTEARPPRIRWIGQRYLNAIVLPLSTANVGDYFPIYPHLPPSLTGHRPLAVQVQTAAGSYGTVHVNLSLAKTDDIDATYMLDIYARSETDVPNDADAVTNWHTRIHELVFQAFQLSVSDRCRDRFSESP